MMRANRFRYVAPRSVDEAARALRDSGPGAMLLAGGTDLVPNMKRRQQTPPVVISLRRLRELRDTALRPDGSLQVGACATLAEVVGDAHVREHHSAFWKAAAQIATPHLRNMGTVGGNICLDTRCNYYDQNYEWRKAIDFCMKAPQGVAIPAKDEARPGVCWVAPGSPRCWAVSSTDSAPALIALGAHVTLTSADGEREIPLEDLYADDGMAYLTKRPDEILTAVRILNGGSNFRSTYWKLRRRGSFDFPVLGVAAAVRFGKGKVVESARVVLGAVASHPVIAPGTEVLIGKPLTDDVIAEFVDRCAFVAKPLDNTDFALGWRKKVARAYLAGALRELRGDDPAQLGLLARRTATLLPVLG
jgi:4-hydroxybenzoyl-CoA reductase subunit beta